MLPERKRARAARLARAAICAAGLCAGVMAAVPAAATAATAQAVTARAAHHAHPPHIMVLWMENTDYSQFAGSPAMPELNELAHKYSSFSQAYGWHYPSLPNYIELLAGSDLGVTNDCDITDPGCSNFTHERIIDQLEAAGIPWHAYYQGDASGCDQSDGSGNYPYWHNSFRYFADFATQCVHISNFGPFLSDLSGQNAPDFVWAVPDLVNSGGDNGTMNSGDSFLAGELPKIMHTSWYRQGGQIVVIYDTGYNDSGGNGGASGGQIPLVVISQHDRGMGTISTPVNTAGVLRSIEHAYGFSYIGDAADPSNGSLGDALVAVAGHSHHHGQTRSVLHGALVGDGAHQIGLFGGTLALQGVYRPSGSRHTIEVGNNSSGVGVVAVSGHHAVPVPGTSDLESVSCTTDTTCYAVGLATSDLDEAVLVKIVNGHPTSVTDLPAFIGLYGIACPSATTCYGVGYDNSGDAGAVTTITDGTASAPAEVPNDGNTPWLNAISCPTSTQCYAAGLVNYEPAIVPITSGTPSAAINVADIADNWYLNGIDCSSVGNCVAVGENDAEQGIVATLTGGVAGTTTVVPGTEYLYGVGCAADGNCLLAGVNSVGTHNFGTGVLVPYQGGKPLTARVVPGTNGLGQTVCADSLQDCVSAGAAFAR
jgi:phosphatidylinositol-3-phosphatase